MRSGRSPLVDAHPSGWVKTRSFQSVVSLHNGLMAACGIDNQAEAQYLIFMAMMGRACTGNVPVLPNLRLSSNVGGKALAQSSQSWSGYGGQKHLHLSPEGI